MFADAIACGNTFVLKPSDQGPSAPAGLAELFLEPEAPENVLGDNIAVDGVLNHPCVAISVWKRPAFGDTDQHGPESVKFWAKTVTQRWPEGDVGDQAFIIPTMQ